MKNIFLTVLVTVLITGAITFWATKNFCNKPAFNDEYPARSHHNDIRASNNSRQYPIDMATNAIDSLQSIASLVDSVMGGQLLPHMGRGVVAYTISAVDLLDALGVPRGKVDPPMKFIRVYLGFSVNEGFKMFVVPVQSPTPSSPGCCGTDLFFDTADGRIVIDTIPGQGNFVLDLISPCPQTCDVSSRLVQNILGQVGCNCDSSGNHLSVK